MDTGGRIAGHYRVIDRIATGGMGVVWLARDERLQRPVAIKQLVLQPGLADGEAADLRRRALREAQIAARLQHPNAIMVFDVTEHVEDAVAQSQPCLVMEYLPSRSLAAVLTERGPLPYTEAAAIGRQVAGALAAAHAARIVHRDVKPGNILLTDSGAAKITDFGISRAPGDATITQTGLVAGTPAYLAPEVARGQDSTPASDVFSLGASLYAAVEGRGPFGSDENQLALLHAVAGGRVEPPRQAGPLGPVLEQVLVSNPAARPTMDQLRESLSRVAAVPAAGHPPAAAPPTYAIRPRRRPVPAKMGVLVASGAAVIALGGFAAATVLDQAGSQQLASPPGPETGAGTAEPRGPRVPNHSPTAQSEPPRAQTIPVDLSSEPIQFSPAGQLVIDYYARAQEPSGAWHMLTASARSEFGSRSAFRAYWDQYDQVWARNAYGLTRNADGSVRVPVDVRYVTDHGTRTEHKVIRVTRQEGQLLIDTPAR